MQPLPPRILIVDDDLVTCELLSEVFMHEGYSVRTACSGEAALDLIADEAPDVLVSDIRMRTRIDGLTLLSRARGEHPDMFVVLMTAFGSIETAIRAVKEGAFDYISKPFDIDTLVATVLRALAARSRRHVAVAPSSDEHTGTEIVGRNAAMLEVYKMIARVSDSPACVLVTGESGTGKELVARAIHMHGTRHAAPFVAVNCGALTESLLESELFGHLKGAFTGAIANKRGIFEQAGEGTVFLDEMGEMSAGLQVKLLRVLQEREVVPVGGATPTEVRARVIAASNSDIEQRAAQGAFRRDLLYRLNVINISLPPLRERRDDIGLLVEHLLRKHARKGQAVPQVDPAALDLLIAYAWPGNVRELENAIERALTLSRGGHVTVEDLPVTVRAGANDPTAGPCSEDVATTFAGLPSLDEVERRYILHVLEATGGNRKRAAEILKIHRKTLYRMAERFNLPPR